MQNSDPDSEMLESVRANVLAALAEDLGDGDISAALIDSEEQAHARVITREAGIFCGAAWVLETCAQVDPAIVVTFAVADGDPIVPEQTLFELSGPARSILTAERTALNFVQLLAGTATRTRNYVALIEHTGARLLDTRKTLPGLRRAQKYAVTCGGGHNHRMGLFDQFLIKENHIAVAGDIAAVVALAKSSAPGRRVEIEVEDLQQLQEAIAAGADIALIDNFSIPDTRAAVSLAAGRIELEASGGINEATITEVAMTGVDYISTGDITKYVAPIDLSMRFVTGI